MKRCPTSLAIREIGGKIPITLSRLVKLKRLTILSARKDVEQRELSSFRGQEYKMVQLFWKTVAVS